MENIEDKSIFRKERFNLKVAQQAYKMSMASDAERYLREIPKEMAIDPAKELRKRFVPKEKTERVAALDLTGLSAFI